jgi:ketosteroid isomerase-like protein
MKTKLSVESSLYLMLALLIASACTPVERDVTSEIEEMNSVYMTAVKSQDMETLVSLHTADAVIMPSNQKTVEGIDAIRHMWNDAFAYGMGYLKITTIEATAYGNIAHETGSYQYFTLDDQMVDVGKYIVVWKKEGEQWKIAKDIWNSSMPMPQHASEKDTIAIVMTKVKPDKYEQLDKFASEIFFPVFNEHFADSRATARMFKVIKNPDGEVVLLYFIDPLKTNHVHDVKTILSKHYNDEDTDKYLEEFRSCLINQEMIYAVPLGW